MRWAICRPYRPPQVWRSSGNGTQGRVNAAGTCTAAVAGATAAPACVEPSSWNCTFDGGRLEAGLASAVVDGSSDSGGNRPRVAWKRTCLDGGRGTSRRSWPGAKLAASGSLRFGGMVGRWVKFAEAC